MLPFIKASCPLISKTLNTALISFLIFLICAFDFWILTEHPGSIICNLGHDMKSHMKNGNGNKLTTNDLIKFIHFNILYKQFPTTIESFWH